MEGTDSEVGGRVTHRGRTIVTLEDVARAAGVHYSTVSRALDPTTVRRVSVDTRKHIQAVAKKMGYQRDMVATGLKRGRTQTVAAVVADLGNPSIAPVLRGIASRLEPAGFMPLFAETQDDSSRLERILNHLLSRRVDAIILQTLGGSFQPRVLEGRLPLGPDEILLGTRTLSNLHAGVLPASDPRLLRPAPAPSESCPPEPEAAGAGARPFTETYSCDAQPPSSCDPHP